VGTHECPLSTSIMWPAGTANNRCTTVRYVVLCPSDHRCIVPPREVGALGTLDWGRCQFEIETEARARILVAKGPAW